LTQVNTNSNSKYLKLLSALIFLCFAYGVLNGQDSTNVFEKIKKLEKKEKKNILTPDENADLANSYLQAFKELKNSSLDSAISYANKAHEKAIEVKSFPLLYSTALALGNFNLKAGNYQAAITYYDLVLVAIDNVQEKFPVSTIKKNKPKKKTKEAEFKYRVKENEANEKYSIYVNLAKCYKELGDTGNELPCINNAHEFAKKLSDSDLNKVNEMYVDYHTNLKQHDLAIKFQKQIVAHCNKQTDRFKKANAFEKLADLYAYSNNKPLAQDNYNKAISIHDKVKDGNDLCRLYKALSKVETKKTWANSRLKDAERYCKGKVEDTKEKEKDSITSKEITKDTLKVDETNELQKKELENKISAIKDNIDKTQKKYNSERKKGNLREANRLSKDLQKLDEKKALAELELNKMVDDLKLEIDIKDALLLQVKLKEKNREYEIIKDSLMNVEKSKIKLLQDQQNEKDQAMLKYFSIILSILIISGLIIGYQYRKRKEQEAQSQIQKHAEEAEKLKRINAESEMTALRAQMNPHFIFNALQSIQNFLIQKNPDDANLYLVKFGKLMRLVLNNSTKQEVSVEDEINALELYMQLESIRLKHPFTFEFKIDSSVNTGEDMLPPLILQPFVENAIKHGLQTKETTGTIIIECKKENNNLIFAVIDNGIGIAASKKLQEGSKMKRPSLGIHLTKERLKVLNETKKITAVLRIIELQNEDNQPSGTRVELILPQTT
jgi:predicted aspartyl protease